MSPRFTPYGKRLQRASLRTTRNVRFLFSCPSLLFPSSFSVSLVSVVDEVQKKQIKDSFVKYDRSLLVADSRRCEAKQVGGKGARSKRAKSYR
jgi:hypothetical protein